MKKFFVSILAIALISMFAIVSFGQPAKRKTNQTASPNATPRVKKPVNNSTDSVADYNKPSNRQANSAERQNKSAARQANQQEKAAQRQAQQQERTAAREKKQQELAAQREQKQKERAEQRQNGSNNRRLGNGQNGNMQDVIISSQKPNGQPSENAQTMPNNSREQLSGGDWLKTNKPRGGGKNQNANGQEDANGKPLANGRRNGRLNRNNPPANPEDPNAATGDGQRRPPSAQNGRRPNVPGARVESTDTNSNNNSAPTNIPGATVTPNSNRNNPSLPDIPGATVTPNNKPGTSQPSQAGNQAQTTPPNNSRPPSGTDVNVYGFDYPERPEEIVTWNQNLGPYGYTTVKEGWEFILTSNIGVAVRKFGRERTVVAHTKCNDPDNYTFGYGGSGGRIDMIMCRPKREGLPRLRPSIMIVPPDRYFDDQR